MAALMHTGAFDPETSIYYAVSHTQPTVYHLSKPDKEEATLDYVVGDGPQVPTIDGPGRSSSRLMAVSPRST